MNQGVFFTFIITLGVLAGALLIRISFVRLKARSSKKTFLLLENFTSEVVKRGEVNLEDKAFLSTLSLNGPKEIQKLATELHALVTTLLERDRKREEERTKFKQQTRALETMGALNRDILRQISSLILVVGSDGKLQQMNVAAARFFGFRLAEDWMTGKPLLEIPQIAEWTELLAHVNASESVQSDDPVRISTKQIKDAQGRSRVLVAELVRLSDPTDKSLLGTLIRIEDQTEERSIETRLREAENLASLGRMSAQVAHEVRNPLHSIGLEAELVAELLERLSPLNSSQEQQNTRIQMKQSVLGIQASVDRLEKIISNYLKLSKLSSGKKEKVLIAKVCEEAISAYAPLFEAHRISIRWSFEQTHATVNGDSDLLEQALGNLLKNAIQALEPRRCVEKEGWQPEVTLKVGETEKGEVILIVQDNGPGVRPEVEEQLFKPFVTSKAQGTGLGLAFVKKVVEDHEGSIRLESLSAGTNPGEVKANGARFVIRLPSYVKSQSENSKVNRTLSKSSESFYPYVS